MRKVIALFRRAVYFVGMMVGLIVVIPFWVVATFLMRDTSRAAAAMNPFHRVLFPLLGIRVEKVWHPDFDPQRGAVILANHQSWLDIPLLIGWVRPLAFLAKYELFRIPFLSAGMRRIRCIRVVRGNREANKKVAEQLVDNLRAGYSYGVYPEGTRTRDGQIQPFRRGIFHIIAGNAIEVVPVTIDGAFDVLPKISWGMFSGTIRVTVHQPIPANEVEQMDVNSLQKRVFEAVASALPAPK